MILAKKIRSLLNGGGTAAGVRGLREAITQLEAEMAAHNTELWEIPNRRGELTLADDAEKELIALKAREEYLYTAKEVVQDRIDKLRKRLDELTASDRLADFSKQRDAIIEASIVAAGAIREAHEKFYKAIELREAARANGFEKDVNGIPILPYMVNLADPAPALDPFDLAMSHYRQRKPDAVAVPATRQLPGPKFAPGSYGGNAYSERHERAPGSLSHPVVLAPAAMPDAKGPILTGKHGASLQHAVRLRDEPQQQQRRPEPRAPLPDVPAPGMVRCRVEIAGYTDAGGVQLSKGALVDVKEGDARVAAQRGSITFVDGAPL